MLILIDQDQPMPDHLMQSHAHLLAIRRGNMIQVVKDRFGYQSGMKTQEEFLKIVEHSLKNMLDESESPR